MMTQADLDKLQQAVESIIDDKRQSNPGQTEEFWEMLREVLLAACIERSEELLE